MNASIHYTLFKKGHKRLGRLDDDFIYSTGVTIDRVVRYMGATLHPHGTLVVEAGFEWNFADFTPFDTPAMVRASLVHDVFCMMTNDGVIPWDYRAQGDRVFYKMLLFYGVPKWIALIRYWAVRLKSKTLARLKKTDYIGE